MNVTLDKKEDGCALLTVELAEADYAAKVEKTLKKFGREHQIPGFRKGHVPYSELKRRFGKQILGDVLNETIGEAVSNYMHDNKINILGEPVAVESEAIDFDKNKEFKFEFELALAPEVVAPINKEIHMPFYEIEVTDEMIDEQDKQFRKRFGAQVPGEEVEADALVKGVIMELNPDGTVKEGEDAIQVIDGIVGPMFFKSKDEADKFIGKKVGDKVVFNPAASAGDNVTEISSMLHIDKDRAADVKSDFEFAISEIIVVRPAELNEEYYNNIFGPDKVHNEEEYRAAIKEMIREQLLQNSRQLFAATARKELMEKFGNFQLPERVLKTWLMRRDSNLNAENIDETFKSMEKSIRWEILSGKIANELEVKVTEEDLLQFAKMIAAQQFAQYGMTNVPDETIERYAQSILDDKKYRPQLYDQVFESSLFGAIDNAVTLDKETVSLDKFKEIAENI